MNSAGREETLKETIDKISTEIASAGGKVETVQKMDKKAFSRVADKKNTSGFYVNVVFETTPASLTTLRSKFATVEDIFRVLFTLAPLPKEEAKK